jgi:mevalonate kinase
MKNVQIYTPAKALLFGEYGVLLGGKAIVVTFFDFYFHISLTLKQQHHLNSIVVKSKFFENEIIQFSLTSLSSFNTIKDNKNLFFFYQLLQPWQKHLNHYQLEIEILQSYSPTLGFGSSSAIIASISKGLWQLFYNNTENFLESSVFWTKVRQSLFNIQTSGSCYDIAVQLAASQENIAKQKSKLWLFQNQKNSCVPKIEAFSINLPIKKLGCFVATQIYSETTHALKIFNQDAKKLDYATKHSALADKFQGCKNLQDVAALLDNSLALSTEQNIIPKNNSHLNSTIYVLNENKISFKTMGAGHGDCLWVLASRESLIKKCLIDANCIPFSFESNEI